MVATAEALNYDVIDTPEVSTDKIVRCYTDSELNDELANLLKDSLAGVRKANLESQGLEIRKRNRELIIREKKKAKLLNMVELGVMSTIMAVIPAVATLFVGSSIYMWLYTVTGPAALYFVRELKNIW